VTTGQIFFKSLGNQHPAEWIAMMILDALAMEDALNFTGSPGGGIVSVILASPS